MVKKKEEITIRSSAAEYLTYGVTSIQGRSTGNVIPDTARIQGSLRFFDLQEGKRAQEIAKDVAVRISELHRCELTFGSGIEIVGGPVINDEKCAALAAECLPEVLDSLGFEVVSCAPWYASDSYARYLERYPGGYAFLGICNEEYGSGAEHHNEYFDVDEGVLKGGVAATLKYIVSYMEIECNE